MLRSRYRTLVLFLVSALAGFALYTFKYADGASYLSTDPKACVNCHIMQPQFDSWQKSSHHGVATCNDCHLPQEGLEKWISKAENGWNHSKAFTLQDFPEPIRLTEKNAQILQANCLRCHADITHAVAAGPEGSADVVQCVHCHRSAGHGDHVRLGGPWRESEIPEELR